MEMSLSQQQSTRAQPSRLRVLVAEDSVLIALELEQALLDCGIQDVVMLANVEDCLRALDNREFDFALVDVRLADGDSGPLAVHLAELGIPFVVCTGHNETDLGAEFAGALILTKPYGEADLHGAIADLVARTRPRRLPAPAKDRAGPQS